VKTKQALKALLSEMEYVLGCINLDKIPFDGDDFHEAIRLGKEALAELEQEEPMAWVYEFWADPGYKGLSFEPQRYADNIPLYFLPKKPQWFGLTKEEENELWESTDSDWELMKRTEAKLREKNHG
jgi:hypothetical protein